MLVRIKWIVCITLVLAVLAAGFGLMLFLYSGIYDMAATHPHLEIVRSMLLTLKRNSVEFHARNLEVPDLARPEMIQRGLVLYRRQCVTCHGAPGESRSRIGVGLNPNPPPLEKAAEEWTTAEIAWIISRGLKMAGMPGFALGEQPGDLWALTAFVVRINTLSPGEYRKMVAAVEGEVEMEIVPWLPSDPGWAMLKRKGDAYHGEILLNSYGCGTCHFIPGVAGANSLVGPPLTDWSKRHYIAGTIVNHPNNLVSWILNPHEFEPETVMPSVGASEEEAWDMAAYLYSLGRDQ